MSIEYRIGDALEETERLESESVDLILFSPPYYGLRDYGVKGQWGLESHPKIYIVKFVVLGRELKRVLKKSGSMYIVLGDTYFGGHSGGVHSEKSTFRKSKNDKILKAQDYQRRHISDGSNWLQPKNLMLMPSRVAIALQEDDGDDVYELENNLTNEEKKYVVDELERKGLIL